MSNLQIKQLYHLKRGPENVFEIICLILYLPFGAVLFLLRIIVALIVLLLSYILPNTEVVHNLIFKLACASLGISVTVKNANKKDDVDVYISNCLSHFDHLAVHAATGAVMPGTKTNSLLSRAFGTHNFGNLSNFETFKKNVFLFIAEQKIPIYFRPEAKITNGRALLKFKTYPFNLASKVQPICLKITRPYVNIPVCTLGSSYWSNVFYYMVSPYTNYSLEFLPAMEKKSLSDVEFAEIVRQNIGSSLKVELSEFSNTDLLEWEKRYLIEQQSARIVQRPISNTGHSGNPDLTQMVMQVREVLPHVPYDAVYRDLLKTRNTDHTITNILEGHVHFIPESQPSTSASPDRPMTSGVDTTKSSKSVSVPSNSAHLNTAAASFGKSAQERSLSFQERKKQLIENARKKYMEKHNLSVTLNNC